VRDKPSKATELAVDLVEDLVVRGPWEFRPDEMHLVYELARLAGDIHRIRKALETRPLIVAGSQGQEVVDPLRGELHRTTARFESIMKSLSIPDEDAANAATWAGRNLARARWS
jgi:hypothetical protein